MAFFGKFEHTVDAKNRLFMPAKYRVELGDKFYIVPWLRNNLAIYTEKRWNELIEKLRSFPDAKSEKFRRFLFPLSTEVSCDPQGRIGLTPDLMKWGKLSKNAVIVGMGDYAEIWASELWKDTDSITADELEELFSII